MLIDWHVHVNDPKYIGPPWWPVPVPMTVENAIEAHQLVGLDRTVISNAVHYIRHMDTVRETVGAIASSNRHLALCRDKHPDKFLFMATCIPGGGDEFLKELERSVKEDDARAVIINSSHKGHYPDEDAAKPFFKLVTDLDIPVFIHPGDATTPAMKDYRLASSIGRPGRQLPVAGATDRSRHLRAISQSQAGRQSSRRRHLRGDRSHGLRLRLARLLGVSWPL